METDWAAVDEILRKRARVGFGESRCEDPRCCLPEFANGLGRFEIHHVILKGMGGSAAEDRDHPDNLRLLHRDCHHERVHGQPREARALGLIRSKHAKIRPSALLDQGAVPALKEPA